MPASCCVKGCRHRQKHAGYSIFNFPNDTELKKLWAEAVLLKSVKSHHRVCEVHFKPELILFVGNRKELDRSAVPTLFCNCPPKKVAPYVTALDHTYSSCPVLVKHSPEPDITCEKAVKHASDCNISREPIKNANLINPSSQKSLLQPGSATSCGTIPISNSTTPGHSSLKGVLNENVSAESPPDGVQFAMGSLFKVTPIVPRPESSSQPHSDPPTTGFKKKRPGQRELKMQLQIALEENDELLSLLKEKQAPVEWPVPVTMN